MYSLSRRLKFQHFSWPFLQLAINPKFPAAAADVTPPTSERIEYLGCNLSACFLIHTIKKNRYPIDPERKIDNRWGVGESVRLDLGQKMFKYLYGLCAAFLVLVASAEASVVQLLVSGETQVIQNSSGQPDPDIGISSVSFTGEFDSAAPIAFEAAGTRVFQPFVGHNLVLGDYNASGVTGFISFTDNGGNFGGSPADVVSFVFTNIVADPDAPFVANDILTTSGDVNGLPLGQILLSFFVTDTNLFDASSFSLIDLPIIQSVATLVSFGVVFDADVDATGVSPVAGPLLFIGTSDPIVNLAPIDNTVPLPGAIIFMITGLFGLATKRRVGLSG